MNEAETRAEYIDPKLAHSGWGVVDGSKILREFRITEGKIQTGGMRGKAEIADYVLVYKNRKIGVIEAKAENLPATEGLAQAKSYAGKLEIEHTYATNGRESYPRTSEKHGTLRSRHLRLLRQCPRRYCKGEYYAEFNG